MTINADTHRKTEFHSIMTSNEKEREKKLRILVIPFRCEISNTTRSIEPIRVNETKYAVICSMTQKLKWLNRCKKKVAHGMRTILSTHIYWTVCRLHSCHLHENRIYVNVQDSKFGGYSVKLFFNMDSYLAHFGSSNRTNVRPLIMSIVFCCVLKSFLLLIGSIQSVTCFNIFTFASSTFLFKQTRKIAHSINLSIFSVFIYFLGQFYLLFPRFIFGV